MSKIKRAKIRKNLEFYIFAPLFYGFTDEKRQEFNSCQRSVGSGILSHAMGR